MTIRYAIGKNTTEGMTHMMCIEGTEGKPAHRSDPVSFPCTVILVVCLRRLAAVMDMAELLFPILF